MVALKWLDKNFEICCMSVTGNYDSPFIQKRCNAFLLQQCVKLVG